MTVTSGLLAGRLATYVVLDADTLAPGGDLLHPAAEAGTARRKIEVEPQPDQKIPNTEAGFDRRSR